MWETYRKTHAQIESALDPPRTSRELQPQSNNEIHTIVEIVAFAVPKQALFINLENSGRLGMALAGLRHNSSVSKKPGWNVC